MKKIALLILSLILPVAMMSAQDQKYTFERFGFKSKYIPVPTVFDETVTVMGNPSKGSYYFYIPSENFQIDVEVKFLEYGDEDTPFAYYYIGSGVVGNRQYNKVILSSNAKLSDIAKGGGNRRSTPYDEKYHVSVLFVQVNGMHVNDMLTCDLYFIKNPTEQEKQAQLEQEREQQRQIEEQQRKEREEAERKARERRAKIDVFLAERVDTIYSIESANRSKYNQDKELLSRAIASAVERFNPQNLDLTVTDSVYIDYMGNIKHSIAVSGTPEISGLEDAVRKQMEQSRMTPMSIKVPGTDTTCTVTSADFYLLDYRIFTESSALNLKKTKSAVSVKSGDRQFYQNNKSSIDTYLSKGNGIYKVDATVKNINGKRDTDVSINKFRNLNASYMLGYNYTPFAPAGFAFGVNNIKNSNWGVFMKFGAKSASEMESSTVDISKGTIDEIPESLMNKYGSFYLTFGTTCSISKYGFLYAGIGVADKHWNINSSAIKTTGFNIEAGIIIRPIKWVGVSVGYNYIAGKSSYGGINIGAVLFLQKGDFR